MSIFPRARSRARSSKVSHYDDGVTSYYSDSRYGDDADSQYLGDDYYDDDDNWDDDNWDDDDAGEDWYQPPDVEVAEAHAEEMNPQHKQIPKAFSTAPTDLKSYGIGVVLYFTFMRFLSRAFVALSVLAIPAILLNAAGDYYDHTEDPLASVIETTSLGNYGAVYVWEQGGAAVDGNGTAPPTASAPPAPEEWADPTAPRAWSHGAPRRLRYFFAKLDKDQLLTGVSYFNLAYLAIFAGLAFSIGPIQRKLVAEVDRNLTTIEDYSVVVREIPDDVHDPQEIWKFFDKRIGKVQDVQVALNTSELLGLANERDKVSGAFEIAKAKWKKNKEDPDMSQQKVDRLEREARQKKAELRAADAAIRALQNDKMGEPQRSILAYVTFQDEESFLTCLKEYRPGIFAWLFRPYALRFRNTHRLVVKQAPPPADIKWENLQFGYWERQFRQFNISLLTLVVLGLAFVAIAGVTTLEQGTVTEYDTDACRESCVYGTDPLSLDNGALRDVYRGCFDEDVNPNSQSTAPPPPPPRSTGRRLTQSAYDANWTLADAQAAAAAAYNGTCGLYDSFCYSCYCLEHISAASVLGEREYCQPYVYGFTMQIVAGASAQGIILVLNIVLKPLLVRLVKYEKHHSNSGEQKSLMTKLFLAQFFNTAINLLVIAASFPWLKRYFEGTVAEGLLFQGDIPDVTPEWYQEVGTALVMTVIATPLSARFGTVARYFTFRAKRFVSLGSAVTQDQLNKAFEGMDFDLSTRYGEVMNVLFVTMTFGAGMPLLVPLAAFAFTLAYKVDMFDFTRASKVPPWYSTTLGEGAAEVLAYAAVGHLLFAVWANSYYRMEADPLVYAVIGPAVEAFCAAWGSLPEPLGSLFGAVPNTSEVARRALQKNTAFYTLTLFVLLVTLVCRALAAAARSVLAEVAPQTFARGARTAEGNPPFELAIMGEQLVGAKTYSIKNLPEYEAAFRKVVWQPDEHKL